MKLTKRFLFLIILINFVSFDLSAQSFSNGFNFNMPSSDTTSAAFLPTFPIKPITGQDFVSINSDGNFIVNGKPIRFWGTNLCSNAAFPDNDKAYYIAGRMRKLGFNLVRFHQLDSPSSSRGLLYGGTSTRQLNLKNMDYMDKLISEFKRNGIYVNMNLNVTRIFQNSDGIPDADSLQHYAKGFTIFDPQLIALQKEYAKQLLTHINPYTGLSLAEDPVMAMVELINENSLYIMWRSNQLKTFNDGGILPVRYNVMLDTMYNSFLSKKYGTTENLKSIWNAKDASTSSNNLIINGDLENSSNSNWYMELHSGASATMSRETVSPYQGKMSAKIAVSIITGTNWHIQWEQTGFSLKKDSIYIVEFAAKSDSERTISVTVMRNNSPYTGYGAKEFKLTTQWKVYSLVVKSTEDNYSQSRLSFMLGSKKGLYYFDDIKLSPTVAKGLLNDETLENKTVKRIDYADAYAYTDQRVKDISEFYIKLHDDFYNDMRSFLKDQIKVRVPIIGTNYNSGPGDLISQSKYDYIDNHAYWQHPTFPNEPWSQTDWNIANTAMVKSADGGTMSQLFAGIGMFGKPYTVSEYDHPFPNRYQTEMMLFTSAYLSFHNADAIEFFDYNGSANFDTDFIAKQFDNSRNPALMSLSPSCAFAYRNSFISKAKETIKINYNPDFVYLLPKNSKANPWGINFFPKELAFIHSVRNESFKSDLITDFSKLPAAPVSPYRTDTDEILFDTQGLLKVTTPKFIGVTGFLNSFPGVKLGVMEIKSANDFGTVTWISLTGDSLISASKSLITVSSKAQNTGMIWDGTTTVHNNWGHEPTEIFPLTLSLKLNIAADSVKVYPLDVKGNEIIAQAQTYYPLIRNTFEIVIDQNSTKTPWFGIELFSRKTTSVNSQPYTPESFRLEQNYPNPFNGSTTIKYYVPYESQIKIDIFDALGREVKSLFDQNQHKGLYTLRWEGKNNNNEEVPSGIYFLKLKSGNFLEIKKLVILR
ncbi:MAG: carbohydrate binding domain-containing protein [Bacteroidota bacterium]|nr:carbohydrate binding domain-containing protein [Bacteroidota bacterium]MDP4190506.1 carbohydrate binding domain-containing protein [Bacteroidota bacterium]MDP4194798.1 carbohydrate binding domain-containing protein [Bacteroidota bacterium]